MYLYERFSPILLQEVAPQDVLMLFCYSRGTSMHQFANILFKKILLECMQHIKTVATS